MMNTTQEKLTGEALTWDLMKFCKGYKPSQISISTICNGEHVDLTLEYYEGDNKVEKIQTLAGVMDVGIYDDIDIILPDSRSYDF